VNSNNDLMPEHWMPPPCKKKSDPLEKLETLIHAVRPIAEAVRDVPDESTPDKQGAITHNKYQVTMTSAAWNRLVKAYDAVKFKDDDEKA
jgi:hypothetical protein